MHNPIVGVVLTLASIATSTCGNGASAAHQPAPPLTAVRIIAVRSAAQSDWETVREDQFETAREHRGAWLEVRTEDVGYGRNQKARLNGLEGNQIGQPESVPPVGTATGFKRTFRFQPWQGGQLTYESFSHDTGARRSASLRIRQGAEPPPPPTNGKTALRVLLFPWIPDAAQDKFAGLRARVKEEFETRGHNVTLSFVELGEKDVYEPADLASLLAGAADVVEVDMLLLPQLLAKGLVQEWPAEALEGKFHPAAITASRHDGKLYGIPHWLCGHFVFSRLPAVANVQNAADLVTALGAGDAASPNLIGDWLGSWNLASLYLDAVADSKGPAGIPETVGADPDPAIVAVLKTLCVECGLGGCNPCLTASFDDNDVAALLFACGGADALLGYSERLHTVLGCGGVAKPLYVASAPLGAGNTPLVFTDSFVLSAKADEETRKAAVAFAAYMNDPATLEWMMLSRDDSSAPIPRYLLPARLDVMANAAVKQDPYYTRIVELVRDAKPFPATGMFENRKTVRDRVLEALKAP